MSPQDAKREIEVRGQSVDAAIQAGLKQLGLPRDQVSVKVVDEGSRGLLGIGSRDAVVRLSPAPALAPAPEPAAPPAPKPAPSPERPKPVAETPKSESKPKTQQPQPSRSQPKPAPKKSAPVDDYDAGDDEGGEELSAEALEAEREAAIEVMTELLDKMHVKATVTAEVSEPDDLTGQRVNVIEINGNDLGVLIGPRGETIDALQFLGRLMVAHKLRRRANFVVDVEGYRQRRRQALTRLAERMGDKVRQRQEPISLEPMPAYERRIIHMTLRDWPDVYTESAGEGKQRKVRIFPKK